MKRHRGHGQPSQRKVPTRSFRGLLRHPKPQKGQLHFDFDAAPGERARSQSSAGVDLTLAHPVERKSDE